MALQNPTSHSSLNDWWQSLSDEPYELPPLSIASTEGVPAPGPITTPQYPPEIEMPVDVVRPAEIEMPVDDFAAERAAAQQSAPVPVPVQPVETQPTLGGLQPGLSIPISTIDALAPLPVPAGVTESAPPIPAPGEAQATVGQASAVPMPAVDAISSVDAKPPTGTQLDRIEHTGGYAQALSREPTEDEQADALAWMAQKDPEAYIRLKAKQTQAIEMERAAGKERIAAEEARRAAEDNRRHQERYAKAQKRADELDDDARRLASEEIDPGRWWHDASTGKTITGIIIAALGGLTQHLNGGRNLGLEAINRAVDRDIAAQVENLNNRRANLQTRRGLVADLFERTGDLQRAEETARIAGRVHALNLYEAQMHRFELGGMRRFQIAEDIAKQKAELALMNAKNAEVDMKRQEAQEKADREKAELEEKIRHNKAQEAADRTRAGADWLRAKSQAEKDAAEAAAMKAENEVMPVEALQRMFPNAPAEAFNIGPTSLKKFKGHLDTFGKAGDIAKSAAEATTKQAQARLEGSGPSGSPYAVADQEGNALVQKDGKTVFEIKDDTQRRRAMDIQEAAQNIRRIADLVKIMRADSGGASSTVGSPEYQELQSLESQVDFETYVGYGLGAPSAGDKGMAAAIRGGKDIASFIHDPSSGFEAYAKGIEEKATVALRKLGYTGDAIKLKRVEPAQALERTKVQNSDVWSSELINSPDEKVRSRAAQRAVDSADAFSRQLDPPWIKYVASDARDRRDKGIFTEEQYEKVMKSLRRQWKRTIDDYDNDAQYRYGVNRSPVWMGPDVRTPEEKNAQIDEQIFTPHREND